MKRMAADAEQPRHTVRAGRAAEMGDTLARLPAAGVGMPFIPTSRLPADRRATLDRFIAEVVPGLRSPAPAR